MIWLYSLPRWIMLALLLGGGVILIILLNPPHSVCDAQEEIFRERQVGFLYVNPKNKFEKIPLFNRLMDHCRSTNAPGGCLELFERVRQLLVDLRTLSEECHGRVISRTRTDQALWEVADLMVRLGWGEKPPESYPQKFGWLDVADMSLFCEIKKTLTWVEGMPRWNEFIENYFQKLPGAATMTRQQAWNVMILSENCDRYP